MKSRARDPLEGTHDGWGQVVAGCERLEYGMTEECRQVNCVAVTGLVQACSTCSNVIGRIAVYWVHGQ